MLVECGFVRAQTLAGDEYTFTPAIGRIAQLGTSKGIVSLFCELHSDNPFEAAQYILYMLCDQEDPSSLLGWVDDNGRHRGSMPEAEQVIIARHLMRHGIIGDAKPSKKGDGKFSEEFDAQSYIDAARVHLGLSRRDAEELSMTEFQRMFAIKFPDPGAHGKEVATREEYEAAMRHFEGLRRGK